MTGWGRPKQVADYCGVSERTLRSWFGLGLRHSRVRGCLLIKIEWLDEFLESFSQDSNQLDDIVEECLNGIRSR